MPGGDDGLCGGRAAATESVAPDKYLSAALSPVRILAPKHLERGEGGIAVGVYDPDGRLPGHFFRDCHGVHDAGAVRAEDHPVADVRGGVVSGVERHDREGRAVPVFMVWPVDLVAGILESREILLRSCRGLGLERGGFFLGRREKMLRDELSQGLVVLFSWSFCHGLFQRSADTGPGRCEKVAHGVLLVISVLRGLCHGVTDFSHLSGLDGKGGQQLGHVGRGQDRGFCLFLRDKFRFLASYGKDCDNQGKREFLQWFHTMFHSSSVFPLQIEKETAVWQNANRRSSQHSAYQ